MKLRIKIPLLVMGALILLTLLLVGSYYLYGIHKNKKRLNAYSESVTMSKQQYLKNKVYIVEKLLKKYISEEKEVHASAVEYLLNNVLENVVQIADITKKEHIWIHNLESPYKIVVDNLNPKLRGKQNFVVLSNSKENLYAFYEDKILKYGETIVNYSIYDDVNLIKVNKTAYIKLLPEKDWVIGMEIPSGKLERQISVFKSKLKRELINEVVLFLFLGLLIDVIMGFIVFLSIRKQSQRVFYVAEKLKKFSNGELAKPIKGEFKSDEIGSIISSYNSLIINFLNYIKFATALEKGEFDNIDYNFRPNDVLGSSLHHLKNSLIRAKELEVERERDIAIRNWANEGLARFGEILRQDKQDIEQISYDVVSFMVQYIEAHQGAIFIYKDENQMLELTAAFAADRNKYLQKSVKIREGLVGACAAEKDILHYKTVPDDYLLITSGLGEAKPKELLFVPMILDNLLFGVIELATLKSFGDEVVDFLKRVSTNIASSLNSVRINQKTNLYLERAKQEAELRMKQEKELRHNMEELELLRNSQKREEAEKRNLGKEKTEDDDGYELF